MSASHHKENSNNAASSSATVPAQEAPADLVGFERQTRFNLKQNIKKKERERNSTYDFAGFSVCSKPAVNSNLIAVGTNDPEAKEHFLTVIDGEKMLGSIKEDPVGDYLKVNEHMSSVQWAGSEYLLAAMGEGGLGLFSYENTKLKNCGYIQGCSTYIRELAVNPGTKSSIAIGGFGKILSFMDLNKADNPYVQRVDMGSVIGSVKWSHFNGGSLVSCCLDIGKFYTFDARKSITGTKDAAYYIDLKDQDMYTHELYDDYNVMLGFGDGKIKHIDLRNANQILEVVQDPYVGVIGDIEYNKESNRMVVSGFTDYSIYDKPNGTVTANSTNSPNRDPLRRVSWVCAASFFKPNIVVASSNSGDVELTLLGNRN